MSEQELTARLDERRQQQAERQTAGDGGIHSMDEVLRELMAEYQPLLGSIGPALPQLAAC